VDVEDLSGDLLVMGIIADHCKDIGVEDVLVSQKLMDIFIRSLIDTNGFVETVLDLTDDKKSGYIEYMGVKFSQLHDDD